MNLKNRKQKLELSIRGDLSREDTEKYSQVVGKLMWHNDGDYNYSLEDALRDGVLTQEEVDHANKMYPILGKARLVRKSHRRRLWREV